jgi:hypothetical protein
MIAFQHPTTSQGINNNKSSNPAAEETLEWFWRKEEKGTLSLSLSVSLARSLAATTTTATMACQAAFSLSLGAPFVPTMCFFLPTSQNQFPTSDCLCPTQPS